MDAEYELWLDIGPAEQTVNMLSGVVPYHQAVLKAGFMFSIILVLLLFGYPWSSNTSELCVYVFAFTANKTTV